MHQTHKRGTTTSTSANPRDSLGFSSHHFDQTTFEQRLKNFDVLFRREEDSSDLDSQTFADGNASFLSLRDSQEFKVPGSKKEKVVPIKREGVLEDLLWQKEMHSADSFSNPIKLPQVTTHKYNPTDPDPSNIDHAHAHSSPHKTSRRKDSSRSRSPKTPSKNRIQPTLPSDGMSPPRAPTKSPLRSPKRPTMKTTSAMDLSSPSRSLTAATRTMPNRSMRSLLHQHREHSTGRLVRRSRTPSPSSSPLQSTADSTPRTSSKSSTRQQRSPRSPIRQLERSRHSSARTLNREKSVNNGATRESSTTHSRRNTRSSSHHQRRRGGSLGAIRRVPSHRRKQQQEETPGAEGEGSQPRSTNKYVNDDDGETCGFVSGRRTMSLSPKRVTANLIGTEETATLTPPTSRRIRSIRKIQCLN